MGGSRALLAHILTEAPNTEESGREPVGVFRKGSGFHICSSDLQASLWGSQTCQGNRGTWDLEEGNQHPGPSAVELRKQPDFLS